MSFADAVRSVFRQYATFSGRARRSEYWWFTLFTMLLSLIVGVLDRMIGTPALVIVLFLALFLPGLAVTVRRLHDTGKTGWFVLMGLIPFVGGIILLVFQCQDSQPRPNQYSPSPKDAQAMAAPYGSY